MELKDLGSAISEEVTFAESGIFYIRQTRKDGKHDAALDLLEKTHRSRQEDAELSDLTTE